MPGLNSVSFKGNALQAEKLNFLVDYFNYFLELSGQVYGLEVENPHSLLDKFERQVQRKNSHAFNYLVDYSEKIITFPASYTRHFSEYSNFRYIISTWYAAGKGRKWPSTNHKVLSQAITRLRVQLERDMFSHSCTSITRLITSPASLTSQTDELAFHIKIIGSALILRRKRKEELRNIFQTVLTGKWQDFVYPASIVADADRQAYFQKRTMAEVIGSLNDIYKLPEKIWYITFIVDGLVLYKKDEFSFEDCKFFNQNHTKAKYIKKVVDGSDKKEIRDCLSPQTQKSLCEVVASGVDYATAYWQAKKKLLRAIQYVNRRLNRSITANEIQYFYSAERKKAYFVFRRIFNVAMVNEFDVELLHDNPYHILSKKTYSAKSAFLTHEPVYLDGIFHDDNAELWVYMENLLKMKSHEIQELVSKALLLNDARWHKLQITSYLRNIISHVNVDHRKLGITTAERDKFEFSNKSLAPLAKKIKSDFFRYAYTHLLQVTRTAARAGIRNFYQGILLEAYEQRNFMKHDGVQPEPNDTILNHTLPPILIRFKVVLMEYMKKHPTLNLHDLIIQLQNDVVSFP